MNSPETTLREYARTAEFWQCAIFLLWALLELGFSVKNLASIAQKEIWFLAVLLITGAFFLVKAFVVVVQSQLKNPRKARSTAVRTFVYTVGTLALALQTIWFVVGRQ